MSDARFDVVFYGEILKNYDVDQVKAKFAGLFSINEKNVEKIFGGGRTVLKPNVDRATARKYQQVLARVGARVKLEQNGPKPVSARENARSSNVVSAKTQRLHTKEENIRETNIAGSDTLAKNTPRSTTHRINHRTNSTGAPAPAVNSAANYPRGAKRVSANNRRSGTSAATAPAPQSEKKHDNLNDVEKVARTVVKSAAPKNTGTAVYVDKLYADKLYGDRLQLPFQFTGKGQEYFKIWMLNWLLTFATAGIYSAWAKVKNKQYFYSNTQLEQSAFEYLGSPLSILKGRVILVGLVISFILLSGMHTLLGVLMGLISVIFFPWLLVSNLNFNARNSAYRNIRFNFDGSVSEAAKVFIAWPLLALVSAGALAPRALYEQQKFIVEGHLYGAERFIFKAKERDYYSLVGVIAGVLVAGAAAAALARIAVGGEGQAPLVSLGIITWLYIYAFFTVRQTNLRFNTSALGRHEFRVSLDFNTYTTLFLTNILAGVLTLGLFTPWARVRLAKYRAAQTVLVPAGELSDYIANKHLQAGIPSKHASRPLELEIGL